MKNETLRILTFNILHGATTNDDFNLDVVAKVILDSKPDLVALQEVDVHTARVGGRDLAAELGARAGMMSAFARAMDFDGGEYGVAILSRRPLVSTRAVALPYTEDNEPRAALGAVVQLPSGRTIDFISTHLDFASERDRTDQARRLNELFGGGHGPAILAGDFNATPGSAAIAILKKDWTLACGDDSPPTFPSDHPAIAIDYVMYAPEDRWRVIESRVIQDAIASDHCACLAVLELDAH